MTRPVRWNESDKAGTATRSRRRRLGPLAAVMVAAPAVAALTPSASAATVSALPPSLAKFAHCPINNPKVAVCLSSAMGGTFQVGNASLTLPQPAQVSLGLIDNPDGSVSAVLPADGTPGLVSPTVNIPVLGGLVNVGATPSLAGVPTLSLLNLLTQHGTAITLPLVVNLSNILLGPSCTIGTGAAPLTLNLTTGTTAPPPPNTPITGSRGTVTSTSRGLVTDKGVVLVDNAFAAPGASGCGLFGTEDPLVDGLEGLPAAAGHNSATLSGTVQTVPAKLIRKYLG